MNETNQVLLGLFLLGLLVVCPMVFVPLAIIAFILALLLGAVAWVGVQVTEWRERRKHSPTPAPPPRL